MVGNGSISHAVLDAGLHVVSGDGIPVAWALVQLEERVAKGERGAAEAAQAALLRHWRSEMAKHDEVPALKAAFSRIRNVSTATHVRPPLVELGEAAADALESAIAALREAFDAIPSA